MYPSWNARAVGLRLSAEETIEVAASVGFAGVDLLVRDAIESGADPAELRMRMDDRGLRGGAWPLPVDWRGDAAQYAKDLRQLPQYAKAAATLGLTRTGTWVLPETIQLPRSDENPETVIRRTVEFHLDRLGKIASILADHGSQLGLEIIGVARAREGRGIPFIHRYEDLRHRLHELMLKHPNVGVLLDAFHLYAAGEVAKDGFPWGDKTVWVHVSDATNPDLSTLLDEERSLPGESDLIDCRRLLKLLAQRGYAGPVTAETLGKYHSRPDWDPLALAGRTKAALSTVWPSPLGPDLF
jgi:sugar phosphate isomerase/epimerase